MNTLCDTDQIKLPSTSRASSPCAAEHLQPALLAGAAAPAAGQMSGEPQIGSAATEAEISEYLFRKVPTLQAHTFEINVHKGVMWLKVDDKGVYNEFLQRDRMPAPNGFPMIIKPSRDQDAARAAGVLVARPGQDAARRDIDLVRAPPPRPIEHQRVRHLHRLPVPKHHLTAPPIAQRPPQRGH